MKTVKSMVVALAMLAILIMASGIVLAMTAEEIIDRRDENQHTEAAKIEAEMVIVNGGRQIGKKMVCLIEGDNALVEFTNPGDRGTKFLKRGDNLWMFFPDAEDVIKLSGHMLEQGIMNSDYSYRDMMESEKLTELYNFRIVREEEHADRPCYVIEGVAREGAEVAYYRRVVWVDKERFVALKEELYAPSGRLLKVGTVEKVEQIEGRWFPTESIMVDKLRRNTRTEFRITSITFDPDIPEGTFGLQNLR